MAEDNCLRLAQHLEGDALAIENAVARVATERNRDLAELPISDWLTEFHGTPAVSIKQITSLVAKLCGVRVAELKSPSRRASHVRARGMAMLAARQRTKLSLGAIGKQFGGRDHTTVMHACEKTAQLINEDQSVRLQWEELLARLDEHRNSSSRTNNAANGGENLSGRCHSRR